MASHQSMTLMLFIVSFLATMMYGSLAPVFTSVAASHGISTTASGAIYSSLSMSMFVTSTLVGERLRSIGHMRALVGGLVLLASGTAGFAFVPLLTSGAPIISVCVVLRVVQGIGSGLTETASWALCAELFRDDLTAKRGLIEIGGCSGWVFGPLVGGLLGELVGFKWTMLALGAVVLFSALLIPLVVESPSIVSEGEEDCASVTAWTMLCRPGVLVLVCILFLANTAYTLLEPTLPGRLESNASGRLGLLLGACCAAYFIGMPLVALLACRQNVGTEENEEDSWQRLGEVCAVGPLPVTVGGMLLIGIGYSLLGPFPFVPFEATLDILYVAVSLIGVGMAATYLPVFDLMMTNGQLDEDCGAGDTISGLACGAAALGEAAGASAGTALVSWIGFRWATGAVACACLVGAMVTLATCPL